MGGRALGAAGRMAHKEEGVGFIGFGEGVLVRYVIALAAALVGAAALVLPAEARRVALVVGNAEYAIGRLANPVNDAAAVADTLEKQLRFDKAAAEPHARRLPRGAPRDGARGTRGGDGGVL